MTTADSTASLGGSWVVPKQDETSNTLRVMQRTNSLLTDNNSQEAVSTSVSQEAPLTPLSSFSESEFLADYEDSEPPAPANPQPEVSDPAAPVLSSASSSPGLELVMPSIMFESTSTSNRSWVIPKKRSQNPLYESRKTPKMPKKRGNSPSQETQQSDTAGSSAATPVSAVKRRLLEVKNYVFEKIDQNHLLRAILNSFFLLMTLHLLIIPELFYQIPSLCQLSGASKIFPSSCITSNQTLSNTPTVSAKFQSAMRTQSQLQEYLNLTIQSITPLEHSLKGTDMALRDVYNHLRTEYSAANNEIDLEFQGAWTASRSISRAFMALKVDLEAVVGNLESYKSSSDQVRLETAIKMGKNNIFGRFRSRDISETEKQEASGLAITNQFNRLDQEQESVISRLSQKTEAFLSRLAKLDDHLESMKEVATREQQRLGRDSNKLSQTNIVWDSIAGLWSGVGDTTEKNRLDVDNKILSELERISSYHRLLADVVGKLDKELYALQKIRALRA
ncbi:hypothetical protein BGW36DRAFT_376584 [Talaromyces proteolyticus]|uniref:Uncharacterized protein n=1 Tax=Talaromyces proteolyticus TaxID=1131652 RepID=A0AAD4KUJ3_9EURO|nr:uncharacterized protein BGW36DRAFT_376584 [Talaromyces proteolyticus]KAH8698679.1 hypothetical protein BGW36DRAFT_376584 [Talaromyces proteolyticus]